MHIPSPGAVCPAIVVFALFSDNGEVKRIVPDTLNTTVRCVAVAVDTAYLKLPGCVSSFKLVTSKTVVGLVGVPLPPVVNRPAPSAVGNAICWAWATSPKKRLQTNVVNR
jgi:hypothetical protein